MDRARLASLPRSAVAFDVETHLMQPGLMAPPLVCGSVAWSDAEGEICTRILDKEATLVEFVRILSDEHLVMVGANIAYDLLVCTVEWARRGRDVLPLIFRALEQGRIYDVLIGEALGAIANGHHQHDPRTGGMLRDPITNRPTKYYSLAIVTDLRLGRKDAKANDEWRMKYYLLADVPMEQWPPPAVQYPQDDVYNTLKDCLAQIGAIPSHRRHRWTDDGTRCSGCGIESDVARGPDGETCWRIDPARNLHSMDYQVWTAWSLQLGAAWGFEIDQAAVVEEITRVEKIRAKAAPALITVGFLKWKKEKGQLKLSESRSAIARAVALAYGAHGSCEWCSGLGKVVNAKKKMPVRRAWDAQKDGRTCLDCLGTGLDLSSVPDLSYTDPSDTYPRGQIKATADVLNEASDDVLRHLADYKADAKVVTSYGPALRAARHPDGRPVPLNLWPNVLLETDRVSYAGIVQLFPRDGALRACIRARAGRVLCSCDYNQGEVVTHAQSCIWIVGESRQAQILLAGKEVHSMFGSAVLGVDYDEFFKNKKKNKQYANARQAAKPWIFGKPGGMGAVKLVQNQRAQGPDTVCPNGPVMIDDGTDTDTLVPGYRGLRFCILMSGASACGKDENGSSCMVNEWGRGDRARKISPTCRRCLECAEKLQSDYFEQFPEARPYFRFTSSVVDNGQPLTDEQCAIHNLPPGSQLDPGEMCMHVSNIIRGGVKFNDASNGYFQSLLAVAAKRALMAAQRECCDTSIRVPVDACLGGKVSEFAGQQSPLLGSRCIAFLHDEILAELLEANAAPAARRLSEILVRTLQEVCPDMASIIKAPPALMRRWFKAAEPACSCGDVDSKSCRLLKGDPEHTLVPWEPPPPKVKTKQPE